LRDFSTYFCVYKTFRFAISHILFAGKIRSLWERFGVYGKEPEFLGKSRSLWERFGVFGKEPEFMGKIWSLWERAGVYGKDPEFMGKIRSLWERAGVEPLLCQGGHLHQLAFSAPGANTEEKVPKVAIIVFLTGFFTLRWPVDLLRCIQNFR